MKQYFLKSVSEYFISKFQGKSDWSNWTFVFSSHRAGAYFKNYLKETMVDSQSLLFGLRMITIDEFFNQYSRYVLADDLTLTFKLYKSYRDVLDKDAAIGEDYKSFDFFYSWAQTFLGDFDDIDKYLVDAEQLFVNIDDWKELGGSLGDYLSEEQIKTIEQFWGKVVGGRGEKRDYSEQFLALYGHLKEIYDSFRKELDGEGIAYTGMLYRDVAENFEPDATAGEQSMHYAFIGFNALTAAERIVFSKLMKSTYGLAEFFWDYTKEMLEPVYDHNGKKPRSVMVMGNVLDQPEGYGAGRFVPIYMDEEHYPMPKEFKALMESEINNGEEGRKVNVESVAYSQSQVLCADEWVKRHKGELSKSALILGDETMLLPVLEKLYATDEDLKVNITMGYPIKQTSVYSLLELLAGIKTYEKVVAGESVVIVRSMSIVPLLQHPSLVSICERECREVFKYIIDNKCVYLDLSIGQIKVLKKVLNVPSNPDDVADYLVELLIMLSNNLTDEIDKAAANRLLMMANRYKSLVSRQEVKDSALAEIDNSALMFKMYNSLVSTLALDFVGDKFDGLQVMGMMETRSLDFDNICVLSLNEGEFPKSSMVNSFIPRNLRYAYGLPTSEYRDSIFAYYFFRLIARAKDLNLVYHSNSEGGEPSRFLMQMRYQYHLWDGEVDMKTHQMVLTSKGDVEVVKDEEIRNRLLSRFDGSWVEEKNKNGVVIGKRQKSLSATAITDYMTCQLMFYFKRVVGLKEQQEFEEEATAPIIGLVFHEVMEKLYAPEMYKGVYSEADKERLLAKGRVIEGIGMTLEDLVKDIFYEKMNILDKTEKLHGRNILYLQAIQEYVKNLIAHDMTDVHFLEPERYFAKPYKLGVEEGGETIWIGGTIDRMQIDKEGRLWVIDYKTGRVHTRNLADMNDWKDKFGNHKVLFQTFLYSYLACEHDTSEETGGEVDYKNCGIVPGVIAVRELTSALGEGDVYGCNMTIGKSRGKKEMLVIRYEDELYKQFRDDFLKNVVEEIFNGERFVSTDDDNVCKTCEYLSLCKCYKAKEYE
ncbi:MAG: PD-(D/E)XK nuclease family protein [Bacteroidales bacterium]|nr:PD-(D/E)XK nuclease family protein [Bacteroidales bacterium]